MVFVARSWDSWSLFALVVILGLSSGVASIAHGSGQEVSGHTTFVRGIRFVDLPEQPELPPIEYGLATHRDTRFFGLWKVEVPVRESQDRMVFAWSAGAPDPREATALAPGDYARVRDRFGVQWTVYEFTYIHGAALHYAYGVRVGGLQHTDDPSVGADGSYNYVLVYRPERLLQPTLAPSSAAGGEDLPLPATADLPGGHALELGADFGDDAGPEPTPARPQVAFGVGAVPQTLVTDDPATHREAAPSPPGIPSLPDS